MYVFNKKLEIINVSFLRILQIAHRINNIIHDTIYDIVLIFEYHNKKW